MTVAGTTDWVVGLQRRNWFVDRIRVTPLCWEPTARQVDRMAADISPIGEAAVEALVVGNAELLLPA